jgi:hypothetical protein
MDRHLQSIAKWGKFLGYLMIVYGAIYALLTIITVVGVGLGVLFIFSGLFLVRSGKQAEVLLHQYDERALSELLENYAKYLKLNGILMIVSVVLLIVATIIVIATGFAFNGFY